MRLRLEKNGLEVPFCDPCGAQISVRLAAEQGWQMDLCPDCVRRLAEADAVEAAS